MAIREKTIEYAFAQSITSVASAAARDFAQLAALVIAETGSRTFRSVKLEIFVRDDAVAAASITSVLAGIALGAVARSDQTVVATLTNTGENQSWFFSFDFTSYFVTNFTGTSMTADCRLTVTGIATINASAKLVITYSFDDTHASAATRTKTVRIPMDGNVGSLTTVLASVGQANQIPNLSTFLPESGKTFRDIFFELFCNEGTTSAVANPQLGLALDAEASDDDGPHEDALISPLTYKRIWKRTDMDTAAAHDLKAKTTDTAMPFVCLCGWLTVTYTYTYVAAGNVLISLLLPMVGAPGFLGISSQNELTVLLQEFLVGEGGASLVQSAVFACTSFGSAANGYTLSVGCGGQTARDFVLTESVVPCGGGFATQRFDSGAVSGSGISFARGFNTLRVSLQRTDALSGSLPTMVGALAIVNYSAVAAAGDESRTTQWDMVMYGGFTASNPTEKTPVTIPVISESLYYASSYGLGHYILAVNNSAAAQAWLVVWARRLAGEAPGVGSIVQAQINRSASQELSSYLLFSRSVGFRAYVGQPDADSELLDIEGAGRKWFSAQTGNLVYAFDALLTYSSITFSVPGTVTPNPGAGFTVSVFDSEDDELLIQTTTDAAGQFDVGWYDDTREVYASIFVDGTHYGRSNNGTAGVDTFDIVTECDPPPPVTIIDAYTR